MIHGAQYKAKHAPHNANFLREEYNRTLTHTNQLLCFSGTSSKIISIEDETNHHYEQALGQLRFILYLYSTAMDIF